MFRHFLFTALLASGHLALAAGEPALNFAPPGTNAVIALDIRAIADSPLARDLGAAFVKGFKDSTAKFTVSSPLQGIDPFKDLDKIVVFSLIQGERQPSLSVMRGRFSTDPMAADAERYRGVVIHKAQSGNLFALLDASTILEGDENLVRAAIDHRGSHDAALAPALAKRVAELSTGKYAVWAVGSIPGGLHPTSGKMPAGADGFQSLDHFDLAIALDSDLRIDLKLHVRAPEDAKKLTGLMQFAQMMSQGQPDQSGVKFDGHVENGTLTVSLSLPQAVVKQALAQQKDAIAKALAQAGSNPEPVARPQISAPAPPSPQPKIVNDSEGNTVQVTLPGKK